MTEAGGRVHFDFEGSLQLARQLWSLADDLQNEQSGRVGDAETASAKWEGPHGTDFGGRIDDERTSYVRVVNSLRDDARNWAAAWAAALHQQNTNNRAAEVQRVRDDRGWVEARWEGFWGTDGSEDEVAAADGVTVPSPPHFAPTATEQVF